MRAMDVAAHVINHCINIGNPISNLKLQKILYLLNMTYLVNTKSMLIDDKLFEAWQYGPVIKEVYDKYSSYAASPIDAEQSFSEELPMENRDNILAKISTLSQTRAWDLVDISHKKGGPWDIVYKNGVGNHQAIKNSLLEDYANNIRKELVNVRHCDSF